MSLAHVRPEELPASLRELCELIGLPAALRLVERWGGVTALYVPKNVPADHALARELGREAAVALSDIYGGDYLRNIPRAAGALRAVRDRAILRMRADRMPPADIALATGLTERWVWEILRRGRDAREQCMLPGVG